MRAQPIPRAPAVELSGVTKRFGSHLAVDNVSLTINRGELFGFLGPNGAGKTTTIKMLVGLLRPDSGVVRLCGFDVVTASIAAKSLTGYVPDHAALYEKLTGREFLGLAADLFQVPQELQRQRAEPMLQAFALADSGNELIQSYSRGMRQKLALCAALIHDPAVLFLDEPTVGLDPAGARQLKEILRHLCSQGKTVFLSTHVLEVAELLCDRVAIVQHGRILADDTPEGLRTKSGVTNLEAAFLNITGGDGGVTSILEALK